MLIPSLNSQGELPPGVHSASLAEVVTRFGAGTHQRRAVTTKLVEIFQLVAATGKLARFIIYGSYVTDKPAPNDVDIFLVLTKDFEVDECIGKTRTVFSHNQAQMELGASIFWVNETTSFASIEDLIAGWQTKRDRSQRGIIEITQWR
jgi:hypothetical protein